MKHLFLILSIIFTLNSWAQISTSGSIPVGAVMKFDLTSCPTGWLPRDGSCVSKTTYAKLFQAIGSRYESTFGTCASGYFRLADVRGLFDRAAGTNGTLAMANATKYTGGSTGSYISDAFQGHAHTALSTRIGSSIGTGTSYDYGGTQITSSIVTDSTNGTPRTVAETRPASISTLDCIKY